MRRKRECICVLAALLSVQCAPDADQAKMDTFNNHLAEANTLLEPSLPRGWRYSVRSDRIRNTVNRLATLANEDPGSLHDQTLVLVIQKLGDGPTEIFFRDNGTSVGCRTVCGVAYRAGDRTGSWTGERTYTGNEVMLHAPENALATIRSGSMLIVEVPSDLGGQHTFNVAGLTWPPASSSR
jgi:hypothetical protein